MLLSGVSSCKANSCFNGYYDKPLKDATTEVNYCYSCKGVDKNWARCKYDSKEIPTQCGSALNTLTYDPKRTLNNDGANFLVGI